MFALNPTPRRTSVMSTDNDLLNGVHEKKRSEYVEGNLKLCETMETNSEVMSVRFSADIQALAVGQADGVIKIYNPDTGQCLHSLSDEQTSERHLPVTSICFLPYEESDKIEHKHLLMATYASGIIKFWHFTSRRCLHTINEVRQTLASAINPIGDTFLTAGADPQIHLYDMETKQRISTMEPSDSRDVMNGHRARVFAVQYHPNQNHVFISGGWDDTVQFWDDRQAHSIRKFYGPHICGDALDIDPVHGHVLSGSWRKDNPLQIWDFNTAEIIKNIPQDHLHGSLIYCCQWLGRDNIVCGGADQNMMRVIDRGTLNTVGQLVDLPQSVFCIDNDRQVKPRVAVGAAKKVYILRLEKKQN